MGIFWKLAEAVVYIAASILTAAAKGLAEKDSGKSAMNSGSGKPSGNSNSGNSKCPLLFRLPEDP